ncbi:hypothetical protein RFI_37783 [Reticulomyxa filosa]|uniref:Kelch motif family protein n=1 Tax=Reticulomyxa filosa TaxID=46433 RepID=X6LCC6_RETFI|nr:hypothetical protein RFI_37783 [Reticulomyxa filosa]|eukprot:ETN99687.1 hypothetical protein RFI_37783 [Reticulomyxa filosa]
MSNQIFETLKDLPIPLQGPQCVLHKHELLICGSWKESASIKLLYYLLDLIVMGKNKHTFVMKYVSIWDNILNKSNELNNYNEWIPFTDNKNHPIIIGRDNDKYVGVRAVIGGINNNLLFITYLPTNISVFDLNTFQFIKHDTLPAKNYIEYHCFVSKSENEQKNKQNYQMLLFCKKAGLSIEYDEDKNTFQFRQIHVYKDITRLRYAYVCINDVILFFGGYSWINNELIISKSVHKYSIRENKWMTFQDTLSSPLFACIAILSEEDNNIHIIGGVDDKTEVLTHIKTKVRVWDHSQLVMICLFFIYFDERQINLIV